MPPRTSAAKRARARPPLRPALVSEKRVHSIDREIRRCAYDSEDNFEVEKAAEQQLAAFVLVSQILKHHVYTGATPGSLQNVYAKLAFTDGRSTGRMYLPMELLARSEVLAAYLETPVGARLWKYIAAEHKSELETRRLEIRRQKAIEAVPKRDASLMRPISPLPKNERRRKSIAHIDQDAQNICRRKLESLGTQLTSHGGSKSLMKGWSAVAQMRKTGHSARTWDVYFIAPTKGERKGRRFRSFSEVVRYFELES